MKCEKCKVELTERNRAMYLGLCKKCWGKVCAEGTNQIPDEVFKPQLNRKAF
ncbi:unnamed protein product [marine sediment metagenome]|uniref:Uncharacterized protein n=1 Tax=marine sediment metagenome TaxID=412755 RepID=X0U8B1_9ZZZZ